MSMLLTDEQIIRYQRAELEWLRAALAAQKADGERLCDGWNKASDRAEGLWAVLNELTTEITQNSALMDNISLAKFERACRALEPKP